MTAAAIGGHCPSCGAPPTRAGAAFCSQCADPTRRVLIRSLLDIRLSRLSMLALGAVSVGATVLSSPAARAHSTAQLAALAALRQRPVTVAQRRSGGARLGPGDRHPRDERVRPRARAAPRAPRIRRAPSAPAASDATAATPAPSDPGSGSDTSTPSTSTTSTTTTSSSTTSPGSTLPKVSHVFEIVLSTTQLRRGVRTRLGRPLPALARVQGHPVDAATSPWATASSPTELAMVSGQGPNRDTQSRLHDVHRVPDGRGARANGTRARRRLRLPGDGTDDR